MDARHSLAVVALGCVVACGSSASTTATESGGGRPFGRPDAPASPASPDAPPSWFGSRPEAPPSPPPLDDRPPYPIVLLHGMAGFDKLKPPLDVTYFAGVIGDLATIGETQVYATVAPPYDTSENRARAIAPQIDAIRMKTGKARVNIVGHSQGGMDARVLASPNGLALGDRIASVTTIATPHRGSQVADLVLGLLQSVPPSVVDQVTSAVLQLLEA